MFRGIIIDKIDFSECDLSRIISMNKAFAHLKYLREVTFGNQKFTKLESLNTTLWLHILRMLIGCVIIARI